MTRSSPCNRPAVEGSLVPRLPTARFGQVIRSTLPPETLWRLVTTGVSDSATAPVWPRRACSSRLLGAELAPGAVIEATYHFFGLGRTVHYDLLAFDARAWMLRYWSGPDHPLWGGGSIEVIPQRVGSVLRWEGAYQADNPKGAALLAWFKLVFERMFFCSLREALEPRPLLERRHEPSAISRQPSAH